MEQIFHVQFITQLQRCILEMDKNSFLFHCFFKGKNEFRFTEKSIEFFPFNFPWNSEKYHEKFSLGPRLNNKTVAIGNSHTNWVKEMKFKKKIGNFCF